MADPRQPPNDAVEVARLGRSHGLAGLVYVHPHDVAARSALQAAEEVWIDGLGEARVLELKEHGKRWLLRTDRIRRVETAKQLVHAAVRVDPRTLPGEIASRLAPVAAGRPVLLDGRPYGTLVETTGSALQPLLRVRGPAGDVLIPATAPYVTVSEDEVRLQDPPAGLLDET